MAVVVEVEEEEQEEEKETVMGFLKEEEAAAEVQSKHLVEAAEVDLTDLLPVEVDW